MIYNVSILSGYTALIGTSMVHLPMILTMAILVRPPTIEVDKNNIVTPEAEIWYWIGIVVHILMSALQLAMFNIEKTGATYLQAAIQLSAFIQIFNFSIVS